MLNDALRTIVGTVGQSWQRHRALTAAALRCRIRAALLQQRLPQTSTTEVHSEDARSIGIDPIVFDLGEPDSGAARIARSAAPSTHAHFAGEHARQLATVEAAKYCVGKARAPHGAALCGLPAHEHIVDAATVLTFPPGNEELVARDQTPTRFSCVRLGHASLPGQAPKAADERRVLQNRASHKRRCPGHASTSGRDHKSHPPGDQQSVDLLGTGAFFALILLGERMTVRVYGEACDGSTPRGSNKKLHGEHADT
jgi:hypothetical protein